MIKRLNTGHRQENHKDEIKLITPPCNNSGGIIDVNELPRIKDEIMEVVKVAPLKNETPFKTIQFNPNLSDKEIAEKILEFMYKRFGEEYDDNEYNIMMRSLSFGSIETGIMLLLGTRNIGLEIAISVSLFDGFTFMNLLICYKDTDTGEIEIGDPLIRDVIDFEKLIKNVIKKVKEEENLNLVSSEYIWGTDDSMGVHDVGTYNEELNDIFISSSVVQEVIKKDEVNLNAVYRLPDGTLWIVKNDTWVKLSAGGGIIDVEELPDVEGSWIGTPLTEDAFKEEFMPIYINTNLSKSKVNKLLNNVLDLNSRNNYTILSWNGSQPYRLTIEHEDGVAGILLHRAYSNDTLIIYVSAVGGFEIPDDLKGEIHFYNLSNIGQYNTELSSLFSSTPFVYKEPENKIDPNAIYRLPDGTLWMYKDSSWVELSSGGGSSDVIIELTSMYEIPEDLEDDKIYKVKHSRIQSIQAYDAFYNNGELTIDEIVGPTSVPLMHITKDIDFNTIYTEDMLLELLNGNEFDLNALLYSYSFIYKENIQKIAYINDFYDDNDNFVGYKLYEDYIDLNNEEWCEGDSTDPHWLFGYRYISSKEEIIDPNYVYMIIPDTGLNTWIIPKSDSTYNVYVEYPEGNIASSYRTPIDIEVIPNNNSQSFYSDNGTYINSVVVDSVPTETKTVKSTSKRQHIYPTDGKFIDYVIVEPADKQTVNATSVTVASSETTQTINAPSGTYYNSVSVEYGTKSDRTDFTNFFKDYSNITEINLIDTHNATSMNGMFNNCKNLTTIPLLDTRNVTTMEYMFNNCKNLTTIPLLDTRNVTTMESMFEYCESLTTIPLLDTSSATNLSNMFSVCLNLTTIPPLDVSNVTNLSGIFGFCSNLKSILIYGIKAPLSISSSTQYEREDLITILNNLSVRSGIIPITLTMGSTNLAKLTDEDKAIATDKGWTLA